MDKIYVAQMGDFFINFLGMFGNPQVEWVEINQQSVVCKSFSLKSMTQVHR